MIYMYSRFNFNPVTGGQPTSGGLSDVAIFFIDHCGSEE